MHNILKYNLKTLRQDQKTTCIQLATKCQITEVTYRTWENIPLDSEKSIPSDKLLLLSDLLGVAMIDLYTTEYLESIYAGISST